MLKLHGLVAAPFTALDSDSELQLSKIQKQAEHLIANDVSGAFICGTTGEGMSLTQPERMAVAERWTNVAGETLKVIVHVGHNAQGASIELARHAASCGADAIAAISPSFFKPTSVAALVDFIAPIAAAAPQTPFYYYHIPKMTGVTLSAVEFLETAGEQIPNLRGVKFTHGDLMEYVRCKNLNGGSFDMAWGVDEMFLGALASGASAFVGSTYNYAAPLYTKLLRAFSAGDIETARECSGKSVDMIAQLHKFGGLRVGKAIMSLIGLDCGPTRCPITPLNEIEIAAVREAYEQIGFFDWAAGPSRPMSVATPR